MSISLFSIHTNINPVCGTAKAMLLFYVEIGDHTQEPNFLSCHNVLGTSILFNLRHHHHSTKVNFLFHYLAPYSFPL